MAIINQYNPDGCKISLANSHLSEQGPSASQQKTGLYGHIIEEPRTFAWGATEDQFRWQAPLWGLVVQAPLGFLIQMVLEDSW